MQGKQRGQLRRLISGSVVTAVTLNKWGYQISPYCKCGKLETVYHICWECNEEENVKRRHEHADPRLIGEARRAGEESPLYAMGLKGKPAVSRRTENMEITCRINGTQTEEFLFNAEDGKLFVDGSASSER